jgi:glycerol-1-phosphate dehydrogenase [NAD(P)+]
MRALIEGLLMTGLAMQYCQSSRPASGAEHQFSHLWDMQHHRHFERTPWHGCKVAIGTLAATMLYEQLMAEGMEDLDVVTFPTNSGRARGRVNFPARSVHDGPQAVYHGV